MPSALKRLRNGIRLALGLDLEPGDVNEKMKLPCEVVRPPRPGAERTLIVMGMPSGGTSMTAGTLSLLGIDMGEKVGPGNIEDQEFLKLVEELQPLYSEAGEPDQDKFERLRALVEKRNAEKPVWGWKDPHSINYIAQLMPVLRNPHFLVICRDHMAAAQTIKLRSGADYLPTIDNYLQHMRAIVGSL